MTWLQSWILALDPWSLETFARAWSRQFPVKIGSWRWFWGQSPWLIGYFRSKGRYKLFHLPLFCLKPCLSFHLVLLKPLKHATAKLLFKFMLIPNIFSCLSHIRFLSKTSGMFFNCSNFQHIHMSNSPPLLIHQLLYFLLSLFLCVLLLASAPLFKIVI